MKIVFTEIENWEKDYLKNKLKEFEVQFFEKPISELNLGEISHCEILSPFIYSQITKEILDKLPNLKLIATRSVGFDHIDIGECQKQGIPVSNVPYYGENTVAEHTFALILALSRKLPESFERTKKGNFSLEGLRGTDLKGKTLGVVGIGHIGKHVIRIAKGFEMNVIAFDPKSDLTLEKELNFRYVDLEYLLKNSDIITLHCPYNKKTHHLINKENIKLIKRGAYLINTARGGVVETEALGWV